MANDHLTKLTVVSASATKRRYCTTHRGEVAADAGSVIKSRQHARWMCYTCQEKRKIATAIAARANQDMSSPVDQA